MTLAAVARAAYDATDFAFDVIVYGPFVVIAVTLVVGVLLALGVIRWLFTR